MFARRAIFTLIAGMASCSLLEGQTLTVRLLNPKPRKSNGEAEGHGEMGCGIQVQQDPEIAISVVTVLELRTGSRAPIRRKRRAGRQCMPVHPVTVAIALRAGQADGLMQAAGKRIALADLLIGSTALELGYSVATANVRHFAMLPDLLIEQL
jgi:predicted nucleic acid-binding protein